MKSLNSERGPHIRRLMPVVTVGIGMCLSSGCSTVRRERDIVPEHLVEEAQIPAIPKARSWADVHPEGLEKWLQLSSEEIKQNYAGVSGRLHPAISSPATRRSA